MTLDPAFTMLLLLVVAALVGAGSGADLARRRAAVRAARVAHEVRGPLAAAQLALHAAARRGEAPPSMVAALELELRRAVLGLEDPRGRADVAEIDLVDLLRCQVETWRAVAAAHGTVVVLAPGPDTAMVRADAVRVAQATSNVVANAIEHGGGRVEVRTRLVGDRVRVEVTDGGPGLPASVAELARRPRGARGHGLAIATGALAGFGGRVSALPSPEGARVAIELPAARSGE